MFELISYILIEANKDMWIDRISIFLSSLTLIVLVGTLYFVKRYTDATKEQTDLMINQKRLSIMPSLSLDSAFLQMDLRKVHVVTKHNLVTKDRNNGTVLHTLCTSGFLSNVGNGPALDISINISHDNLKIAKFKSYNVNFIKSGQKKLKVGIDLEFTKAFNSLNDAVDSYKKSFIDSTVEYRFEFQDIEGNWYSQTNKVFAQKGYHGSVIPLIKEKPL